MRLTSLLRRGLFFFLLVVVVITVITGQGLHGSAAVNGGEYSLTFLVMLYVNIFLVIALGYLVIRNLSRLWLERRRRLAGSQLRTRMVLFFVALSLLPTLVITILSVELLNQGVDSWFSDRIARALSLSLEVARAYYRENQRTIRHDAEDLVRNHNVTTAVTLQGGEGATAVLEVERQMRGLDEIAIIHADGTRLANAGELPFDPIPDLTPLQDGSTKALLVTNDTGHRVRAFMLLGSDLYLVTGRWIDRQVQARMESIEAAYVDYNHLRAAHSLLKDSHTVTLVLITLLLLLASIWSGFRIADNITNPISELVVGTRQVAAGDLSVTLSVTGEGELATLMAAFNAMTLKLTENRRELESNYALLEERRRFMEAIVSNISAGVISVNRWEEISLMNRVAGHLLAMDPITSLGKRYTEEIPDPVLQPLQTLLQNAVGRVGRSLSGENPQISTQIQLLGREKPITLLARLTLLEDGRGGNQGFIATFDDLTEVVVAQRTRAWSEVARRIAHEIKNPLTPIQLWAQRMRRKYLNLRPEEVSDWRILDEGTTAIINQVEELRDLVNEFSTFARLPRPELHLDDLNATVQEVLLLHQAELKSVKVKYEPNPTLPMLVFDRKQIKQVLTNLITNALAAIHERNEGEAASDVVEERGRLAITSALSDNGQWLYLQVEDNGHGIPPADRDRVFEPYFTTKHKGTGLGLAIVKKIIEDHGGSVRFRESRWGGALVEVQLPLALSVPGMGDEGSAAT